VFRDKDCKEIEYQKNLAHTAVGFLSENDPYEASGFEVLRSKWIDDSKKLYGEFKPAHGNQNLRKANR